MGRGLADLARAQQTRPTTAGANSRRCDSSGTLIPTLNRNERDPDQLARAQPLTAPVRPAMIRRSAMTKKAKVGTMDKKVNANTRAVS